MKTNKRVILMVMDSLGVGALPDAAAFGDEGANTIQHIVDRMPDLAVPNLKRLGYGRIPGIVLPGEACEAAGAYGKAAEQSGSKDTIAGHWEIAGLITKTPFRTFTDTGFPDSFIEAFEKRIGRKVIGNYSASGTKIIEDLGLEQRRTGCPIVYTSADSVLQIAADTAVIPLEELYDMCAAAREMLTGDMQVGRVIARPYTYIDGKYTRTSDRRDYALDPPEDTVLDAIVRAGLPVWAVGKIEDIFNHRGITNSIHTKGNQDGVEKTLAYMEEAENGLIFTNLVDFDSLYGHRRDPEGYGHAIERFDAAIPSILAAMREEDIFILTADHGNDPVHTGWNHTREYVPILVYGAAVRRDCDLGVRDTFADIGATVCEYLGVPWNGSGSSFLKNMLD